MSSESSRPQKKGDCNHFMASHAVCPGCRHCSQDATCSVCQDWSREDWMKLSRRRSYQSRVGSRSLRGPDKSPHSHREHHQRSHGDRRHSRMGSRRGHRARSRQRRRDSRKDREHSSSSSSSLSSSTSSSIFRSSSGQLPLDSSFSGFWLGVGRAGTSSGHT